MKFLVLYYFELWYYGECSTHDHYQDKAGFLKLFLCGYLYMCVGVCVCVHPKSITN